MDSIGATDIVRLIPCTDTMLEAPLSAALSVEQLPPYEAPRLGTRRLLLLSGMHGSEVTGLIAAYREVGACSSS